MLGRFPDIFILIPLALGALVHYNFKNSVGQVVSDLSGNQNYAVLGENLLEDSSDPIPTDRGLYFTSSEFLSLPPNSLQIDKFIPLKNFYIYIFIYIRSPGLVLSVIESENSILYIRLDENQLVYAVQNIGQIRSVQSQYYSNAWDLLVLKNNFNETNICPMTYFSIQTSSGSYKEEGSMLDSNKPYRILLGGNSTLGGFEGFISEFYIFDYNECLIGQALDETNLFPKNNPDPYTEANGSSCECSSYSCTGSPVECIQCSQSCDLYCTNTSSCIDIVEICKPYAIAYGICDNKMDYLRNCRLQESSSICIECNINYTLSQDASTCCLDGEIIISPQLCGNCNPDCLTCTGLTENDCTSCSDSSKTVGPYGNCTCPLGTNLNTGLCNECLNECLACETPNTCIACKDLNSEINQAGRCVCKPGFYFSGTDCDACLESCFNCSGPGFDSCVECKDPNAIIEYGICFCVDGYYWNEENNLCEVCHGDCKSCTSDLKNDCTQCRDENSEVLSSTGICTCKQGFVDTGYSILNCSKCHETCDTCSGVLLNECHSCKDQNALLKSMPGKCECALGYSNSGLENSNCEPCHPLCTICSELNSSYCLTCNDKNSYLDEGVCKCLTGFYYNETHFKCEKCEVNECKYCRESVCLECFEGFSISNNNCIQNELELNIQVLDNNTIIFNFSEPLLEDLKSDQFTSEIEGQNFKHSLEKNGITLYEVNIDYTFDSSPQVEVNIKFKLHIKGQFNSILKQLTYNCILITPPLLIYKLSALLTSISNAAKITVVASGIASIFLSSSNGSFWVTFNTIQIISYIPLFNIKIPDFLKFFLIGVRPAKMLPNFWTYTGIFDCDTPEISEQFYEYGFTCNYFLLNIGVFLLVFFGAIFVLIFILIFYCICCKPCKPIIYKKLLDFRFSFFIRFWIHSYVELLMAATISLNFLSIETTKDLINSTIGFIVAVVLLASPFYILVFYEYNKAFIEEKDEVFFGKYSPLIADFNLETKFRVFIPIFFLGRILFVFILYYGKNYPIAQVITAFFIHIFNIFFMINYKIYKLSANYKMYLFQEIIVAVILFLLSQFLFGYNEQALRVISYGIIAVTGLGVAGGIFPSFFKVLLKIKNFIKAKFIKSLPLVKIICDENSSILNVNKNPSAPIKERNNIQVTPFNSFLDSPNSSAQENRTFII